jgi:hypothetical protein
MNTPEHRLNVEVLAGADAAWERDGLRKDADAIGVHAYASSDKHLSGYRLTIGFDNLEQVQAAHQAVVNFGKAVRARNGS